LTAADDTMSDPGRGGLKAVRWRRFLQDHGAVRDAARSRHVVLGTYAAEELRACGVGVVQLWPTAPPRSASRVPLGMQAFRAMTAPPASCLWVAGATRDRITDSLHVEFMGDIARVAQAVDIQPDGVGREFVLGLEPARSALARGLDALGLDADGGERFTRFRAWFPWHWPAADPGRPQAVPVEQLRSFVGRFRLGPGASPAVTEQLAAHCADVPALPDSPTRTEVAAVLDAFFTGGRPDT
jgi:hypothetical protein